MSGSLFRRGGRAGVAALGLAGLVALALGSPSDGTSSRTDSVGGGAAPTIAPAPGGSAGGSSPSGSTIAGGSAGGQQPAGGGASPTSPTVHAPTPGGGTPAPPPSPPGPDGDVAVVSGALSTFAFGSKVGLPLMCSAAAGALNAGIADPNLARVITEVTATCADFGNQGAEALAAMEQQLAFLAAANPALDPIITELSGLLRDVGGSGAPFGVALVQLAALLDFFRS